MAQHAEQAAPAILLYRCRVPAWAGAEHVTAGLARLPDRLHEDILRFRRTQDRLQRLVARHLLGEALRTCGLQRCSDLNGWRQDRWGRPCLEGVEANFSLSHSDAWVVCALAPHARVGVDIETYRFLELDSVRAYLTPAELERIGRAARPEHEALRCWSLREALLKADGRGLLAPEQVIRNARELKTARGTAWRVESFATEGACLYLATDHATAPVVLEDRPFRELLEVRRP